MPAAAPEKMRQAFLDLAPLEGRELLATALIGQVIAASADDYREISARGLEHCYEKSGD